MKKETASLMNTAAPGPVRLALTTMHPVHPQRYCLSIEDPGGCGGTRLGGFTDDPERVRFARGALENFIDWVETDDPRIRGHVEAMLARRAAHIRSAGETGA